MRSEEVHKPSSLRFFDLLRRFCAAALTVLLVSTQAQGAETELRAKLEQHAAHALKSIGAQSRMALSVIEAKTGQPLFEVNPHELMSPASVLKLFTSYAALKVLGAEYRFPTEIFADRLPSPTRGDVGSLYIRGYGDPTMVEERVWAVARGLRARGVTRIEHLVVDDTLFIEPPGRTGASPYQAGLSAASVNYNCYAVEIIPGEVGRLAQANVPFGLGVTVKNELITSPKPGRIVISESAASGAAGAVYGKFQELNRSPAILNVVGSISPRAGLIREYHTSGDPARQYAELFKHQLSAAGIAVEGKLLRGSTPSGAVKLELIESKELGEILIDLNHYSNNFVAGQVLYALGQDALGVFRFDAAISRVRNVLADAGISSNDLQMYDGSGLDKRNRTSTRQIAEVLAAAYRDFSIAPVFIASLSRFGYSGTLKRRPLTNRADLAGAAPGARSAWGKTGTLDRVSSLAGYAETADGRTLAYAVLINGPVSKAVSKSIENNLVRILAGLPLKGADDAGD